MIQQEILNSFKGRNILVTGGTGLIGRQIVSILCGAGADVTSVSLDDISVDDRAKFIKTDLSILDICLMITRDIDYVFHLAGIKGSVHVTKTKPASFFVPLLMMNTNLLEAARINKVKKLVYTSSVGAYSSAEIFKEDENREGEPMDEFPGYAKRMAEKQIQAYKIQYGITDFSVVRLANIYGPGDSFDPESAMVIPSLINRISNGESPLMVWGDGSAIRDFLYSKDAAEGIIQALYYGTNADFVNLGSGIGTTIKELVKILCDITKVKYRFDSSKSSGFPKRVMNIDRARELINFNPATSLEKGLRETWFWYKTHKDEYLKKKNYFKN